MTERSYPAEVDVAIVGSGPTASAYARILSEEAPGATIAMFETGPTVSNPPGAHVKNIPDEQRRTLAQRASEGPGAGAATVNSPGAVKSGERRARPGTYLLSEGYSFPGEDGLPVAAMSSNVGGMGAHWTAACPRPSGKERVAFVPDLDGLLDDAERLLGVSTHAFDDAPFSDIVLERLAAAVDKGRESALRVQPMPLAVHREKDGRLLWSGADVVMGEATRQNPRFELFDESLVTKVMLDDGRAVGVEVQDRRTGVSHEVSARFVVVGADALRTPQLLWTSGIRPDALGRYLNDQPQIVFASRLEGVAAAEAAKPQGNGGLTQQSGVAWVPYIDDVPFHGQIMQLDASPVPLANDDPVVPGSIVGLGLFCAKDLQRDDRVVFDEEARDAYGMPAMRIHYRLTDRDREVIERAKNEIVRLGNAVGRPLDERPFVLPPGSSLHYQGSTRMGVSDDGESVCSPDSEVWGAEGLFVAGNGVIPTATACNPTLTAVALAIRGARRITRNLASSLLMSESDNRITK